MTFTPIAPARQAVTTSIGKARKSFVICDVQVAQGDVLDLADARWQLPPRRMDLMFDQGLVDASTDAITITPDMRTAPIPAAPSLEVPAGWYTDPQDASMIRYFDGAAWTEHTSPATEGSA